MAEWQTFYVLVGSSGAALIGMQFVVITLVADSSLRPSRDAIGAFATPTVVHLTIAVLLSATMTAPWHSPQGASFLIVLFGAAGFAYSALTLQRMSRQTYYRPVWEDWLWYSALPSAVYVTVAIGGALLRQQVPASLFLVAGTSVGLLMIGIHNAWDTITDIVARRGGHGSH